MTSITMETKQVGNGMAVAGFVCALVGAVLGLVPLFFLVALPLGILGIVFGFLGRRKAKNGATHKGLATTAVVLGLVAVLLSVAGVMVVNDAVNTLDKELKELESVEFGVR